MTTGWVYDIRFLDHDTGPGHPERPDRLRSITRALSDSGDLDQLIPLPISPATNDQLCRVHCREHVCRVKQASVDNCRYVDVPDSAICPSSFDVARLAAGAAITAVDEVLAQNVRNAFCAVRPPGHHAEHDGAMGFCLFNNVAIAAAHAIAHGGLTRVAIVDFDVHHGNGTQHIFEARRDVLYISLHESPDVLYPGTGFASETGTAQGQGFTLNLPLPPGSGDQTYAQACDDHVIPRLNQFQPQLLLISAGFDSAQHDPLAHMNVTPDGFCEMTRQLTHVAKAHCDGRLVSVLEGGYDLAALADSVTAHIQELIDAAKT